MSSGPPQSQGIAQRNFNRYGSKQGTAILGQTVNTRKLDFGDHTRELLRNRPRSLTIDVLCEATGLERHFISSFINGRITHPSVHKVQKLYECVTGKPLEY